MTAPTRVLIAGGGTAGHLLPGISVALALQAAGVPADQIHFVGAERGPEADLVPRAGYTVDVLPGRGVQRRLTLANIGAVRDLIVALVRGIGLVRRRRPGVVVVLGGYASFACGVGAVLMRRPLVLLEQNRRAGAVNRALRFFAAASAVSFEGTDLPRATVTGNPLRPEIRAMAEHPDREGARAALGLPADRVVIGVFSGSLGSRHINEVVRELVVRWGDRRDLAVRHVIGRRDFAQYTADAPAPPAGGLVYQVLEYEDQVPLLLAASDVAVTRAGGTVFELMAAGLPSVLVPLPIATRDHQRANAEAVVAAGGAVMILDAELTVDRLESVLSALLEDPARLEGMRRAMRDAAVVDAAERAARLVLDVADGA